MNHSPLILPARRPPSEATGRQLLFLVLFATAFFQWGAHTSQAFVNYPAWQFIGADSFPAYHQAMTRGALRILLGSRIAELLLVGAALAFPPRAIPRGLLALAAGLALGAFASSIFIQLPLQSQLGTVGNTAELLDRLRTSDWLRQVAEWCKAALYFWMITLLVCRRPVGSGVTATAL